MERLKLLEGRAWKGLSGDDIATAISDLVAPGNTGEHNFWFARASFVLSRYIKYLLDGDTSCITWIDIRNGFTLVGIIESYERNISSERAIHLKQLLDQIPGWSGVGQPLGHRAYEQFGYVSACLHKVINELRQFTEKRVNDFRLYLRGAYRLGGDARLRAELLNLFSAVSPHPAIESVIFEEIPGWNLPGRGFMDLVPKAVKNRMIEYDIGL
ncbi:hypothetical protein [Pseudomonas putida]|uniref:Uncharacterized protein n=1 Tax=Pseudomonas putida TaxID=303 RepID=A0A8I1EAQ6_PSEPU|nr:hypothetical protein [Pseudomonas putida]MBI6882492.1 hypothetical protein [Pseudomonas putida]